MTTLLTRIAATTAITLFVAAILPKPVFAGEGSGTQDRASKHYISETARSVVPATFNGQAETKRDLGTLITPLPLFSPTEKKIGEDRFEERTTIADLQYWATNHNPTLRQLKQKIYAAHGNMIQAGLKPNPTLSYEGEEIGDGGKAGKHGLVLEQEFLTGGKLRLDRNIAAWEKDALRRRMTLQYQSIQNDVKARAYEVLAVQKTVEINKRLVEIGRQSVIVAEELGKAGEVSKIDLLQMRAKANEALSALKTSQVGESLAWKKLAAMIGMPELEPRPIADSLEQVRPACDRDTAWYWLKECSPQLAVVRANVQKARATLARENAGKIPDLTVGGGVHYDYGERQTLGSVGVGMPLKVFDRNQGNIKRARGELAATCRELDRQMLLLYEKYVEIDAELETARQQVQLYKDTILPDVQESLELCLKGYRQGEYGYIELLNAQQQYLESQTQYVESLKNHAIACVYLDGFLASGGLENEME